MKRIRTSEGEWDAPFESNLTEYQAGWPWMDVKPWRGCGNMAERVEHEFGAEDDRHVKLTYLVSV